VSSNPAHDEVYSIQHFVIKFISDLRQVGVFPGTPVSSTNKTDRHDITEILLKVTLNTIPLSQYVKIFLHLWFSFPLKCAGLNKHHAKNTRMLNQSITWLATYVWQFTKMTKMLNQCITDLWFALPKNECYAVAWITVQLETIAAHYNIVDVLNIIFELQL
jgi:hypothetical protein